MKPRQRVLGLLILLSGLTYLDRICISVAGPRMQADLHIDPVRWGWVTAMFTLSYGIFEIPTGALGDRIGPRRVVLRIVLWWSAFTALTGMVSNYFLLLLTRLCFGAGEAGAFPNVSIVITRWFSPARRASIVGFLFMASQIGGAAAPLLVVPIQMRFGWRVSFYVFGSLGLFWAAAWHAWYAEPGAATPAADNPENPSSHAAAGHGFPWRQALSSPSLIAIMVVAFCYVYVYTFFQTWFHTFLVKGRGFSEGGLLLSALPYAVAATANLAGGAASDAMVRRLGLKWGRRTVGVAGLGAAGVFTIAAMVTRNPWATLALLSLVYGGITLQQAGVFGVCMDIGRSHSGVTVGMMNSAAQVGGLVSSVAYGYIVNGFGNYDAPFVPMAALLALGSIVWLKIDASQALEAGPPVAPVLMGKVDA